MKSQINPAIAIGALVVVLVIAGFFIMKGMNRDVVTVPVEQSSKATKDKK